MAGGTRDLVFISFRVREALQEARDLKKALLAKGYRCFVSEDDLVAGEDWPSVLADNLDQSAMVVALATETYGAKGTSTQGTFEELRFAKKRNLALIVIKMCEDWKETRTEMELGSMQCLAWEVGQPLPAPVLTTIADKLAQLGVAASTAKLTAQLAQTSIAEASWESLPISSDAQALLVKGGMKPHVVLRMVEELGFSDLPDLQFIDKDMVTSLKLKPLEAAQLNKFLEQQKPQAAAPAAARPASARFQQKTAAPAPKPAAPAPKPAAAAPSKATTVTVTVHPHALAPCSRDNGWSCSGMTLPGGCKKGCTGFDQSAGWGRHRCDKCDFDLCDGCLAAYEGAAVKDVFNVSVHNHPLLLVKRDNGWSCSGMSMKGGCKKGCSGFNQTSGWTRYRCTGCDFDLCQGCLDAYPA